jgi:PST family polysaccharide transporter
MFFSSFFPTLSKQYAYSKEKFFYFVGYFAKKIVIFSFLASFLFFIFAPKIVLLFLGQKYLSVIPTLRLLLISTFILFISAVHGEALKIINHQKEYLKIFLGGVILYFLLNLPLIYLLQAQGVGFSSILSSLLITILIIKKFKDHAKISN